MKFKHVVLGAMTLPLLTGCAFTPVALNSVGPEPRGAESFITTGYIQVFSDTEEHDIGDGEPYYTHKGYGIYNKAGKQVKYVPNHIGDMDESPTLVEIPTGHYQVEAESSTYGPVTVPVVIEAGKTTILHLDGVWRPASNISSNQLVRLPDGDAIGWSSKIVKSSK